jgi:surface antigen
MIKFFTLVVTILLTLLLPLAGDIQIAAVTSDYFPASYPTNELREFSDNTYEMKLKLAKNWTIRTAFENKTNDAGIISKRLMVESGYDLITIDIWANKDSLINNYNKLEAPFLKNTDRKKVNGKVNGLEAILSSNLDNSNGKTAYLSAFFQNSKYTFRVTHPLLSNEAIDDYLSLLTNLRLQNRLELNDNDIGNFKFPLKRKIISMSFSNKVFAGANNCGSYQMIGNRFPCCPSGGNCTWWGIYKRQDLKDIITIGNAGPDWITQATQAGVTVQNDPTAGSLAVWGPKDGRSGHVAFVNSVTSSDLFNISEMNCSGSHAPGPRSLNAKKHYGDYWKLNPLGFIGYRNELIIQNQTITSGDYTSTQQITVKPESNLTPTNGDINLKIQ